MRAIPVVLCIDIEPDARLIDPNRLTPWYGCDDAFASLEAWRAVLRKRTGRPVHINWFIRLDPQIEQTYGRLWPIEHYRAHFEALRAQGDTIGIHPHAWRWDSNRQRWFTDNADQAWMDRCVRDAVTSFSEGFHRPPEACRFGDRCMTNATMATLESLGIRYDLTVEAGMRRVSAVMLPDVHTADLPNYRWAPRTPYRPSPRDYRRQALGRGRELWVVPISTGRVRLPRRWRRTRQPLNLAFDYAPRIFEQALARSRPMPVIVGRAGDFATARWREAFRNNLEFLATHPRVSDLAFKTVEHAVAEHGGRESVAGRVTPH